MDYVAAHPDDKIEDGPIDDLLRLINSDQNPSPSKPDGSTKVCPANSYDRLILICVIML